jgi:hypothetical protein
LSFGFGIIFVAAAPNKKLHQINLPGSQGWQSPSLCQGPNGTDAARAKALALMVVRWLEEKEYPKWLGNPH